MDISGKTAAEIFDNVRQQVLSGRLRPGEALPPVRELAARLDVNRNTVAAAYKRLVTAGVALTQGRLGTVIRHLTEAGEQEGTAPGSALADLAGGNPNPAWLPDAAAALAARPWRPRLYGETLVDAPLAQHAQAWFAQDCPPGFAVDLSYGAVDAIERLLAAHLVAGDKVVVEHPCFLGSINTLRVAGLQAVGVPVDAQGLRADALEAALEAGAQAVILTPRAHNPTGCSLSAARARALRDVLARHPHVLLVVDDHFALLSAAPYHDVIPPAAQRWALVRSVSKVLGPDLRLACIACDPHTSQRLRLRLAPGTQWVSHLLQDIVARCLSSPAVAGRVAQARDDYARRRAWLARALAAQGLMPDAPDAPDAAATPADGLNLWLPLAADSQPLVLALARRGWLVRSGEPFGVAAPAHGLRITVSTLEEEDAGRLALDIARCLAEA
ncbi:transcriptional regulator PtsJ [Cupriavidus sp. USMAA2-4]|uniref:MocR-like B6 salvage transcription factor PtsJ n=1 Tax=Cupriavidus sp. USMAA2-4 TaxID=876364 RepID=UPI0008A6E56A|nr:transcriptional regulator PtsJ [Cupriavidus sp. USMAA2-4]AOY94985.1 transcriptional regulator PtsJ [Cupriavidus sp. USMAA2-4]